MSNSGYSATGGTQDVFFDRSGARLLPTIVKGEGVHLIDENGRRLLDACSGPFLASLGQGNERVLQAMMDQGRKLTYTYSRTTRHQANADLAERLTSLAGFGFERAHLTSGGSEAIEMAIKFLRSHAVANGQPQRTHLITLLPGYHGATLQTIGLNGDVTARALWDEMIVYSEKIPAPLTFRSSSAHDAATVSLTALEEVIDRLGGDRILAMVMEPIGGQSSGANVPHPSFARGVRALCDEHGVKLVFDEVVTAFRTGHFLAAHADTEALPDVVVLAKGLGGGYAPLGAALFSRQMVEELAASFGFTVSHSYDANPMACAAGSAVLDEIVARDLINNAQVAGTYLRSRLESLALESPLIGDVRGRGLLLAIELVANKDTLERFPATVDPASVVLQNGLNHGLLLYSRRQNAGRYGDWLMIAPPLIVDTDNCDELINGLEAALSDSVDELLSHR
jgi:adenosylmethionine-8-amino-7-oxononanoate aminotransferase